MSQLNNNNYKLLLLGNNNVGKSSILSQFADNYFDEKELSTVGFNLKIRNLIVNKQNIKLSIWDISGLERFRDLTFKCYNNCDIIIIVYDVTDRTSFNNIKTWMNSVHNSNPYTPVYLIGNKYDIISRVVEYNEGRIFANKYNLSFMEISAKNKSDVEKLFDTIGLFLTTKNNPIEEININNGINIDDIIEDDNCIKCIIL